MEMHTTNLVVTFRNIAKVPKKTWRYRKLQFHRVASVLVAALISPRTEEIVTWLEGPGVSAEDRSLVGYEAVAATFRTDFFRLSLLPPYATQYNKYSPKDSGCKLYRNVCNTLPTNTAPYPWRLLSPGNPYTKKSALEQTMKTQRGNRGIALLFL
jgi:hypothetical protein